jgi:hypothetical protein
MFSHPNPRDLWKWMAAFEQKTGNVLRAIVASTGLLGTCTNPNVAAASDLSNLIYPWSCSLAEARASQAESRNWQRKVPSHCGSRRIDELYRIISE